MLCASTLLLASCAAHDPHAHLRNELVFLRTGVNLEDEEQEVRRVLAQRNLRVVSRFDGDGFIALGAATRDGQLSAVRVITSRGVQIAEDASQDDLFAPASVSLLEHFGGPFGDYMFVASARIPRARAMGCVTLHRVLPDGTTAEAVLDVSDLGTGACVANIARGNNTLRVTIAWPTLHALETPALDAELAFVTPPIGQPLPIVPVAKIDVDSGWLSAERARLSVIRLAHAPFSGRHAAGIARAAIARLAGESTDAQIAAYRNAVHRVLPGSTEAETVAGTVAYMARGWSDPDAPPPPIEPPADAPPEASGEGARDAVVIEPDTVAPLR